MYKLNYYRLNDDGKRYIGTLMFDDISVLNEFLSDQISCHGAFFSDEIMNFLVVFDLDTDKPVLSLQFY